MASARALIPFLPLAFLLACHAADPSAPPAMTPASLPPLEGFWGSEGYGYQLEITPDGAAIRSQVTALSCVPTWRALPVARDATSVTYRRPDRPATIRLSADGAPDRLLLRFESAATDVVMHRLPRRLAVCDRPTPDTPRSNFDVFAATMAESYPFFVEARVDWDAVVARERSKVDAIFADAGRWRALVIDVRINPGGIDGYGLAIASRLTAAP